MKLSIQVYFSFFLLCIYVGVCVCVCVFEHAYEECEHVCVWLLCSECEWVCMVCARIRTLELAPPLQVLTTKRHP